MIEAINIYFLSGLLLGLLGSMHCVGMCGPIALAIPHRSRKTIGIATESLAYNLGRVTTYALLGLVLGFLGFGLQFIGLQSNLSIIIGSIVLLAVLLPRNIKNKIGNNGLKFAISKKIQPLIRSLMKPKSIATLYLLGLLNGLLPCGMVYFALAGSIATSDAVSGAIFMAAFGFGTLPAMSALFIFKSKLSQSIRQRLYKAVPYGLAVMATLMILRGMSLGIPYVSPDIQGMYSGEEVQCLDNIPRN
jgi:hypothetical protein